MSAFQKVGVKHDRMDSAETDASKICQGQIRIAFSNEDIALMVKQCMEVDDELQPARLTKDISQQGHELLM